MVFYELGALSGRTRATKRWVEQLGRAAKDVAAELFVAHTISARQMAYVVTDGFLFEAPIYSLD